jgi:hypothetical protein
MDGMSVCTHTVHSRIQGQLYTGYLLSLTGKRKKSYIYIWRYIGRVTFWWASKQMDCVSVWRVVRPYRFVSSACVHAHKYKIGRLSCLSIWWKGKKLYFFFSFSRQTFFFQIISQQPTFFNIHIYCHLIAPVPYCPLSIFSSLLASNCVFPVRRSSYNTNKRKSNNVLQTRTQPTASSNEMVPGHES